MSFWEEEETTGLTHGGLSLLPDFVTPEEAEALLAQIDAAPWDATLARRVQHYGYRYAYKARQVAEPLGPLPGWVLPLAERMLEVGFPQPAQQIIVNEYLPGQGIGAHTDSDVFGPVIASLGLGGGVAMVLQDKPWWRRELYLPPRSLLVLKGPARAQWQHAIPARKIDPGHGTRDRRVSLTFRTLA